MSASSATIGSGSRIGGGRLNCDKLWRFWYVALVTALQGYMVYSAISRYMWFKEQVGSGLMEQSVGPLNFYLAMIIASLTLFPIFLYTSLMRMDNYANDGLQLGRDTNNTQLLQDRYSSSVEGGEENAGKVPGGAGGDTGGSSPSKKKSGCSSNMQDSWLRLKQHFLPYGCCLHAIASYCLLIPMPVMHGDLIRIDVLTRNRVWHSDLDVIFFPDSYHPEEGSWQEILPMSPEFFNWFIALVILGLRYPSPFWSSHRGFSLLFSFLVLLTQTHILIEFCAVSVLYKLSIDTREASKIVRPQPMLNPVLTIIHSIVGSIIFELILVTVFDYGFDKFIESLSPYRHFLFASVRQNSVSTNGGTSASSVINQHHIIPPHLTGPPIYQCSPGMAGSTVADSNGTSSARRDVTSVSPSPVPSQQNLGMNLYEQHAARLGMTNASLNGSLLRSGTTGAIIGAVVNNPAGGDHNGGNTLLLVNEDQDLMSPDPFEMNGANVNGGQAACYGYRAHILAMAGALLGVAVKAPIVYDCLRIYRSSTSKDPLMLVNSLITIGFICVWLMVWFAFIFKRSWKFRVHNLIPAIGSQDFGMPGQLQPYGASGSTLTNQGKHLQSLDPGSPVYTCFHDDGNMMANGAVQVEGSAGTRSIDCCSEDTEASSSKQSGPGVNNYVYLHHHHQAPGQLLTAHYPTSGGLLFSANQIPPASAASSPGGRQLASMFSSVTEQHLDPGNNSDSSYGSHHRLPHLQMRSHLLQQQTQQGLNSPLIGDSRPTTGVLKYAVRRESLRGSHPMDTPEAQSPDDHEHIPLVRQDSQRKPGVRVTFKEVYDTIPTSTDPATRTHQDNEGQSPQTSSNNSSSDSGIDNGQKIDIHGAGGAAGAVGSHNISSSSSGMSTASPDIMDPNSPNYSLFGNNSYRTAVAGTNSCSGSNSTSSGETIRPSGAITGSYFLKSNISATDYSGGAGNISSVSGSLQRRRLQGLRAAEERLEMGLSDDASFLSDQSEHRLCSQV